MAAYKFYSDASFEAGEDATVLDIVGDLGRPASAGYIINDGAGAIGFELSEDGTTYGDVITLAADQQHVIERYSRDTHKRKSLAIRAIRIQYTADSSYRIYVE